MIDLTIKTLDSQNHAFSVDDDITVAQFKEKIAEVINIPVESQRLIYCGRVLQDAKKLQEYDVNGKVVHLVQRAPPSATRRSRSPIMTGNNRRPFTNAMYLGSMAFPTGLMEAQGMVRPPPTQSLSGSRLAVARRMIRRAETILNNLEGGTRSRESPPEEPQDDVTPVFAAQVIVPHTSNDDALAASLSAAVSAVENGILQAEQSMQAEPTPTASTASSTEPPEVITPDEPATANGRPAAAAAAPSSAEQPDAPSSSAEGPSQSNGRSRTRGGLPRNSYGTIEMSRLLDDLNKIHERLQPYMERYHTFMRTDPVVTGEQETRDTQQMINRVSEIMHLLGHAYHSLSDVMVQVSTPAPRPLLCRPILIQHSAVVQAGIPIQVEAQINLTPDRRPSDSNSSQTGAQAQAQAQTESQGAATNGNGSGATSATPGQGQPQAQAQAHLPPNVHEIRIDSFPFEFRGFQRHPMFNISTAQARPQGQGQTAAQGQSQSQPQAHVQSQPQGQQNQSQAAPPPTGNNDSGSQATETNTNVNVNANANAPAGQQQEPFVAVVPPFSNNPNMEFFMEVTPESITIDSLETTVVTSAAQADNVLRGTFGGVPPEFIQSLVLHAIGGEVMGATSTPNSNGNMATFEFPANATANDNSAAAESNQTGAATTANPAANGSNVNSQARGNTQTHPTTSTQTRSTARPHEHLAQHTMQGFDPFLPCNSHHIHRRRMPVTATTVVSASGGPAAENNPSAANEQQNNNQVPNPIYNILQGLLRSLGNTNLPHQPRERNEQEEPASAASATGTTAAPSAPPPPSDPDQISLTLDFADLTRMLFDNRSLGQSTTLASVLQNFPDHQYTEGDSLFTDLVMTLARGLTFSDVIALNTGHIEPLVRIRPTLRTFFRNRVLEGECPTQAAIDRGANRLITELQPILELMSTMRVRDNIDIVESATQLCRTRFPNIISLLMSRMTGSLRSLVDLCLLTIRQLCALALHSCEDGQAGVEEVFRALIARYTVGVSPDIHQWTITTSLTQIRHFLRTLDVSPAAIQPYIVVRSTDVPASIAEPNIIEPEAMECEDAPVVESSAEPPAEATNLNAVTIIEDETDPLPNVVIGSEPWHCGLQTDWIPIITRDNQRQRRQNPQAPFSDAYLSGMPSKRRKIVASAKPQGNLSQVISDGVRRAVTASGLTNAVPLDAVSQAASADLTLQSAYRDLLRTSVQSELRDNPDFTPERFPNAANYFNINK